MVRPSFQGEQMRLIRQASTSIISAALEPPPSVRYGIRTRTPTKWDIGIILLLQKPFLGLVVVVLLSLVVGTAIQQNRILYHGATGNAYVYGFFGQVFISLSIIVQQRYSDFQAKRKTLIKGREKRAQAKLLFLPALETLVWETLILTVLGFAIVQRSNPHVVLFFKYRNDSNALINLFFSSLIQIWRTQWSWWCIFMQKTLSRCALVRAFSYSLFLSCVCAAIALASSLPAYDSTLATGLRCGLEALLGASCVVLAVKAAQSSRKSALPMAIGSAIVHFYNSYLLSISENSHLMTSNSLLIFVLLGPGLQTSCLYWSLMLDTKYWRGITRVPMWCSNAKLSPYEQIPDVVIENSLPMLLDMQALTVFDFAFIKFGQMLGAGAMSRVYQGEVTIGPLAGTPVALKVFTPTELSSETLSELAKEVHIYNKLQHARIMRMHGVCVRPPDICMVCELCDGGSLFSYLKTFRNLDDTQKLRLSTEVAEAVCFIHTLKPPIIHRDLKSQNFLTTKNDIDASVKLADFGTCREVDESDEFRRMTRNLGSLHWMSPEVMRGSDSYGLSADIFSLGVVFWEIWSQQEPFEGVRLSDVRYRVTHLERLEISPFWPKPIIELLKSMWHEDPEQRPTAEFVVIALRAVALDAKPSQPRRAAHNIPIV